jgi:Tfp pilus assembly protein PilW
MLMRPLHLRIARDERGFGLMETLVALLMSVVVAGALFAILEVSLRQTSKVTDYIQASQLGRTAMTAIVDELHSACIAPGFAPVLEKSTPSELRFVTAFSGAAEITSAQEHRIKWQGGVLSDSSFASNPASAWPAFTFNESATSVTRIGEHIEQSEKEPIFKYYKYNTA